MPFGMEYMPLALFSPFNRLVFSDRAATTALFLGLLGGMGLSEASPSRREILSDFPFVFCLCRPNALLNSVQEPGLIEKT